MLEKEGHKFNNDKIIFKFVVKYIRIIIMSDNQDLKSKILLMRQKNFGEVVNESNEKNDNEKPVNAEIKNDEVLILKLIKIKMILDQNKVQEDIQYDINPDISELKENLK